MRSTAVTSLLLLAAAIIVVTPGVAQAQNSACFNYLDRQTYSNGFTAGDFSSSTDVNIVNGRLQLNTDERELGDTNRITVRTRQKLTAHYVFESAGASHTFGYFIFDDNVKKFLLPAGWNFTSTVCASTTDCDAGMSCQQNGWQKYCAYPKWALRDDGTAYGYAGNNAYDWFEALYISSCNTCTPNLLKNTQSDGGLYPHLPNLLESLVAGGGGWIFLLADDDDDTGVFNNLAPVADKSTSTNGSPDYDVNGDGVVNTDDRTVELGTFDAGTELVFFLVVYYGQDMRRRSAGMGGQTATSTKYSEIIPYFSKRVLNPDYLSSGTSYVDRDIGCPYGTTCNGYGGWIDAAALNRLQSLYGLTMPHEVKRIYQRLDGQSDHIFVGAPSTDPSWWVLGFEDLYDHGDRDFNDLVFLIFRTNGGETVSNDVATEIPANQKSDTTITKVHFKKQDNIPVPPCSSDPDLVRIEYYLSVSVDGNGDPIWLLVEFPPSSPNEVTIDLAEHGLAGSELRWKAVIISDNHDCKPTITDVDVGYEALRHGEYLFTSPVVLANALYRGGMETRAQDWTVTANDYASRGHFKVYELYEPQNPNVDTSTVRWDAGERLAQRHPDARTIFTSNGTTKVDVTSGGAAWLLGKVLSATDRTLKLNAKPVYDFDKDGDSDDDDARWLIQWTRGWETPTSLQRAWKLGAINRSTAAIVQPPGEPVWLDSEGIPTAWRTAYRSWANSTSLAERRTVAYVGAQDGMLHAFDAGAYRWGDNPATSSVTEYRGYFQWSGGNPDYGTGAEKWAYIPPSLLSSLKNNKMRTYYPEENPPAMVDGSIAVSDVMVVANGLEKWKTAVFFPLGLLHPYISALDVTDPENPAPLWAADWSDPDFQGSYTAPSTSWLEVSGQQPSWIVAVASGVTNTPADVYLWLIDVTTGQTVTDGKIKLNVGLGTKAEQAYGVAGRPILADSDGDGVTDRIYVADTNGRVWRYERGAQNKVCLIAEVGQPIYVTPATDIRVTSTNTRQVTLYFGTGDDPSSNDTPNAPYAFYALVDTDLPGACSDAELLYKYDLPPDEKVWADAAIAADRVYFGTSTGDKADICSEDSSNPGHIYGLYLDPTSPGVAQPTGAPVSGGGNVITGLMVHDQHVLANTVGGKSVILGGSTWNNISGLAQTTEMKDVYWNEVINP
ncbi:MAG: hypothetical protein ABI333_07370 [bacterium]